LSCLAVACCTLFGTSKVLKHLYPDFILLHQKYTTVIVAPSPSWIVSTNDAFGIAQKYRLDDVLQKFNINNNSHTRSNNNNNKKKNEDYNDFHSFLIESASLRRQFQQRYGRHARSLLGHGLSSILDMDNSDDGGNNNTDDYGRRLLLTTLTQILADKKRRRRKHQQDRREHPEHRDVDRRGDDYEFRILVVGNAAAAGYGNYHSQAYSFLLQRLLQPSFQTLLGLNLVVTNLAMDGVAEFPLSWCLTSKNYYSSQHYSLLPDVIVWDFPRTSSTSVQRLEAFIRHWSLVSAAANDNNTTAAAPLLIFREQWKDEYSSGKKKKTTKNKGVYQGEKEEQEDPQYLTLLKYYRRASVLSDATLLVHEAHATRPFFEQRGGAAAAATALPRGLIDWHKFGGPAGSSSLDHIHAHLSLQQHELVAWLIGMHFLAPLELLAAQSLNFINNINNATSATSGRKTKKKKGGSHPTLFLDKQRRRSTMTMTRNPLPKPLFLQNVEWMDDLSRSTTMAATSQRQQLCYTTLEYMVRDRSMQPIVTTATTSNNEAERTAAFVDEGHGQAIQQIDSVYIPSNMHELLLPLDGMNNSDYSKDDSSATIGQDSELLLPKSGQWYNHHGWVLDMDTLTKRHKQQTRSSDFLGFADWKKAYFGAHGSGTLRLFLPLPLVNSNGSGTTTTVAAGNAIKVLILCELSPFNEDDRPSDPGKFRKRLRKQRTSVASCTLREDVSISVGGVATTTQALESIGSSTTTPSLYDAPLQPQCRHVVIPPAARLMTRTQAMAISDDKKLRDEVFAGYDGEYGLLVELTVTNPRVVWNQGPCSLSHVIYQPQEGSDSSTHL
jgi:hypothetical protein